MWKRVPVSRLPEDSTWERESLTISDWRSTGLAGLGVSVLMTGRAQASSWHLGEAWLNSNKCSRAGKGVSRGLEGDVSCQSLASGTVPARSDSDDHPICRVEEDIGKDTEADICLKKNPRYCGSWTLIVVVF